MKPGVNAKILRTINRYMNIYLLVISGSLTMGLSGITLSLLLSDREIPIMPYAFFTSCGIGFLLAYFLDKRTGYKYEKCQTRRCS